MYFQKVAELEHLTKAAEALHIAQPALSRTIRSMEEELDVSLFTHQGRNIHLTRDGHILLKYTNKILGSLDDLRQETAGFQRSSAAHCKACYHVIKQVNSGFSNEIQGRVSRNHFRNCPAKQ